MGIENVLSDEGRMETDPLAQAARERIKAKRGRPRSAVGGRDLGRDDTLPPDANMEAAMAKHREALERLWNPNTWAMVGAAPFDVLLLATGKKAWDLKETERLALGESTATFLQFWSHLDPKWLALANLVGTFTSVAAAHWVLYRTEMVREELAKAAKA